MWRIHVTRTFKWVLRWVSLLCMQTCWYGFHGCILVLSHKCDYRRQVPKRELHELACHLQTIHLSQMHVFNFINSKLIWKFTFNSKWNQFSYQNFRKIFVAPRPCPMRYRSAELKGRKAFTSCVQLRPVPEALSSTFWFFTGFCSGVFSGILLCLWLISEWRWSCSPPISSPWELIPLGNPKTRSIPSIPCCHSSASARQNVIWITTCCRCRHPYKRTCVRPWSRRKLAGSPWDTTLADNFRLHMLVCDRELFLSMRHFASNRNYLINLGGGHPANRILTYVEVHCLPPTETVEVLGRMHRTLRRLRDDVSVLQTEVRMLRRTFGQALENLAANYEELAPLIGLVAPPHVQGDPHEAPDAADHGEWHHCPPAHRVFDISIWVHTLYRHRAFGHCLLGCVKNSPVFYLGVQRTGRVSTQR